MAAWYRDSQYTDASTCDHCGAGGILKHHPWCVTINKNVMEAYDMLLFPEKIGRADRLYLHTLQTCWDEKARLPASAPAIDGDDGA